MRDSRYLSKVTYSKFIYPTPGRSVLKVGDESRFDQRVWVSQISYNQNESIILGACCEAEGVMNESE